MKLSVQGYTLIELLVVISIISILAIVGFVNFKDFSSDQVAIKAVGQIQSLLRLAQSNATTSTLCKKTDGTYEGGVSWSLIFRTTDSVDKAIDLACGPLNVIQKTYILENAIIYSFKGFDCGSTGTLPFTITYSNITSANGVGALTFSYPGASPTCLTSTTWTFIVKNTLDTTTTKTKTFILSKGGTIDVQ